MPPGDSTCWGGYSGSTSGVEATHRTRINSVIQVAIDYTSFPLLRVTWCHKWNSHSQFSDSDGVAKRTGPVPAGRPACGQLGTVETEVRNLRGGHRIG